MKGLSYIKAKQQNWAKRKGYELVGGTLPNEGEKNYVDALEINIFGKSLYAETIKNFMEGDGGELKDSKNNRAKMKAIHSSSALPVNIFQYWQYKDPIPILYACRLTNRKMFDQNFQTNGIRFEQKFEISPNRKFFPRKPNLDVVIDHNKMVYAIESKFTEPYQSGKKPQGLREAYFSQKDLWKGMENLKELAVSLSTGKAGFEYLDVAQLIKHILGLKNKKKKSGFVLLYLWYDVIGPEGTAHRAEIERFAAIVKQDNIDFRHITYQEVIVRLANNFREDHKDYVDYLTERYL